MRSVRLESLKPGDVAQLRGGPVIRYVRRDGGYSGSHHVLVVSTKEPALYAGCAEVRVLFPQQRNPS